LFLRSFLLRRSTATKPSGNRGVEIPKNEHDSGENHTKMPSNTKAWTPDEDKRLLQLVISNASVFDIAADLGRTVKAVRARAPTPYGSRSATRGFG
jgi:hypothetical protein